MEGRGVPIPPIGMMPQMVAPKTAPMPTKIMSPPTAPADPLFALLVPGRPMVTNFRIVDSKKMVVEVPTPAGITDFGLSLLRPALPANHAVAVYYSLPPFKDWQYLGSVGVSSPSAIFRAPWAGKIAPNTPVLQVGLSVENAAFFANLTQSDTAAGKSEHEIADAVKAIGQDLHQYIGSFAQSTGKVSSMGDVLILPANALERWIERFQTRHRIDPLFFLRKRDA